MNIYSPRLNKSSKRFGLIKDWIAKPERWFIFYMTIAINAICFTALLKLVQLCYRVIF